MLQSHQEESVLGSITILVVEDDAELRSTIRLLLENEGYLVLEAGHGQEAQTVLTNCYKKESDSRTTPGLIITDLQMPIMNGWELLTFLKTDPKAMHSWGKIPLIVISAAIYGQREILAQADALFAKPVDAGPLLEAIERLLLPTKD